MFPLSKRLSALVILTSLIFISGCSSQSSEKSSSLDQDYEFVSVGYASISAQQGNSEDIKMLNAIKASKLEAYNELAEQVYGVMLTSKNSLHKHQFKSETLKSRVSGLVRGAKVLRTYHDGDLYITELGLNMSSLPYVKEAEFADAAGEAILVRPQVYY